MKKVRTKFALIAALALVAGAGQSFAAWDGKSMEKPETEKIGGKDFYLIANEANLAWFSDSIYRAGGTSTLNAKLTRSLDLGGKLFMPIAAGMGRNLFAGTIDGNGFTISNLYIDASKLAEIKNPFCEGSLARCNAQNAAFIAVMSGGTVKDIVFENIYITASASTGDILSDQQPVSVGGVVAWQKGGTIENCTVSGKILTSGNGNAVGGIVGNAWNGTLKNDLSTVSIYASGNQTYIGGIVGFIRGKAESDKVAVESCAYDGNALVNSGDGKSGGVVGNFEFGALTVTNAYYDKDVATEGVGAKTDSLEVEGKALSEEELNVDKVVCALNGGELKDGACNKDGVWSVGETHIVVNGVSRNESGALMFEVKFDANGGVFEEGIKTTKLLKVGDKITSTEIIPPTRGDTVFAGWSLASDAEVPDEDLGAADKAKTVFAVWKKMFTVKFDANGGSFPDETTEKSKVVADGAAIDVEGFDVPQTYTSEEEVKYYFSGWALEADAETALETLGPATDNVTLFAVWTEAPTYTVTYDTRGFGVEVDYVQEGNTTKLPEDPTAAGYKFAGWFTDTTFAEGTEFDPEKPIEASVTVFAKWTLVEYTISYLMGKGANNEANPISYTIETPTIKLQPPEKKGYYFDGWYYDKEYVNTATQITAGSTGNVKLYAKWEIKTFTVTYMAGEFALEVVDPDTKSYGDTLKLKEASFTRYGYLQDGWSTKDGGKKKYDLGAEYTADADITLFPHWKVDPTAIPTVAKAAATRFGVVANGRTLELSGVRSGTAVTVFDMRGHVVAKATASASSFSVGSFAPGMYLVRVGSDVKRVAVR